MVVLIYGFFGENQPLLNGLLATELLVVLACRRLVLAVFATIDEPARELSVLGQALRRMERESFSSARLRRLQTSLAKEEKSPSREIAYLLKLVEYFNQSRNLFFMIVSIPLMWTTQFAFAIEAWRIRCGPSIGGWLAAFGEFEALCALAGYAYEHPEDPFPEVVDGVTVLECEEVRHPLLLRSACVPNSICLGGQLQLLLVSGSNMSGKSTLLRTVGSMSFWRKRAVRSAQRA